MFDLFRIVAAFALNILSSPKQNAYAQGIRYGVASWPEAGYGNHRVRIGVTTPNDAVWAHIEWRRRDRHPEQKDIRIFDATTVVFRWPCAYCTTASDAANDTLMNRGVWIAEIQEWEVIPGTTRRLQFCIGESNEL